MAQIIREFVAVNPTEEESRTLFKSLSERYTPILQSTFAGANRLLGLPVEGSRPSAFIGELYADHDPSFSYVLKFSGGFEVGSLGRDDISKSHETFMETFLSVLVGDRRLLQPTNRTFQTLLQDYGAFTAPEEDRKAVQLLADENARKVLKEIVAHGRRERNEKEAFSESDTLDRLEKLGLIKREFFIFCRLSGKQIMMVESREAIDEASKHGFKCFACGRAFSEEKLTQYVSRTALGRKMSGENRWLTIACIEALETWNSSKKFCVVPDGEVTNLFFGLESSLVMIEIKDSPYRLKDAYLLSKKIEVYQPMACFLMYSGHVSSEVSRFLERDEFKSILTWGNSVESLKKNFAPWALLATKNQVKEALQRFADLSELWLDEMSLTHFFSKEILLPQAPVSEPEFAPPPAPAPVEEKAPNEELMQKTEETPVIQEELPTESLCSKNEIIAEVLHQLSNDISGRETNLQMLLQDLGNVDRRWNACLLSEDGLVVASTLDEETSELLASFGGECYTIAQQVVTSHNFSPMTTITMASENFLVELFKTPGFYLAVAANLETLVTSPRAEKELKVIFQKISRELLEKKSIQSVILLDKKGRKLQNAQKEGEQIPPFEILFQVFQKLASRFGPFGKGDLQTIATRTLSSNFALTQANHRLLGISCLPEQAWEEIFPTLLALGAQIGALPGA